jgi:trigger factor
VLEAAADLVPIPLPEALVDGETRRRIEDLAHRLSHQNATLEEYLDATDQEPEAFIDGVRAGSARAMLADLALRAVVVQEGISVTEDEIEAEVQRLAEQLEQKVEKVRRDLERRGVLETVRSDLARGKALEFLIDHATVVDEEGNVIDLTFPEELPAGDADKTSDEDQTGRDASESSADESTEDESTKERA